MSVFAKKNFIRNNEALKAPNVVEKVTPDERNFRIQEITRCMADPIYFAEKYFTIISPKKGKHIIEMYPKQKDLVRTMVDKNRIIALASRQVGKCVFSESKIKVRNKTTGEIQILTIEEFTNLQKSRQMGKESQSPS